MFVDMNKLHSKKASVITSKSLWHSSQLKVMTYWEMEKGLQLDTTMMHHLRIMIQICQIIQKFSQGVGRICFGAQEVLYEA